MLEDGGEGRAYLEIEGRAAGNEAGDYGHGFAFEQCQHDPDGKYACGMEEHDLYFRLTCYKSFIPLGVKDSSLRLYICHHERGTKGKETAAYHE